MSNNLAKKTINKILLIYYLCYNIMSIYNIIPDHSKAAKFYIYHQICMFPNKNNKHYIRKYLFDAQGQVKTINILDITNEDVKKMIDRLRRNEYKCYQTYDFKLVPHVDENDRLLLMSDILNTDSDYTGYASFIPSKKPDLLPRKSQYPKYKTDETSYPMPKFTGEDYSKIKNDY